jgi:hypothetical protein
MTCRNTAKALNSNVIESIVDMLFARSYDIPEDFTVFLLKYIRRENYITAYLNKLLEGFAGYLTELTHRIPHCGIYKI